MTRHPVKSLYVFDIDDTLFRTSARARVVNTKGQVKYLSSWELKDYKFSTSEKICFAEFRDAKKFAEESQPIESMIKIAQDCIKKTEEGSKTILLTARADLDCKTKFLEYLNSSGLDTNNIYVERAGNLSNLKTSEAKKLIISNYLKSEQYKKAYLFDDSLENILSFVQLSSWFSKIKFYPRLVLINSTNSQGYFLQRNFSIISVGS
jgi:tRNA U34 2-thiouridine synthase MnmA/TrmU